MKKDDFLKLVKRDEDLSQYSTYKIGGKAKYFIELDSSDRIIEILDYCRENNIRIFILGGGSNILFPDEGFEGLIIKINNDVYKFEDEKVRAGAGARLQSLVQKSVNLGLSGLEYLAGIPGSVGGAIRGNAGAYGHEISAVVVSVNVIYEKNEKYCIEKIDRNQLNFSYRNSKIKEEGYIVFDAELKLKRADKKEIKKIVQDIIKERNDKQPYDYPSAGCVFKNLEGVGCEELEKFSIHNKVPVAKIIEELGLKGQKIGGAQVSDKHANFIINKGNAKASDIIKLINIIKEKVMDKYGVELEEEIKIVK